MLILEFNTGVVTNPFNNAIMEELTSVLAAATEQEKVRSIVFYGGEGNSFCAGGDFKEVQNLHSPNDVSAWIDRVVKLYQTSLRVSKPIVAAVDKHAIGIGFQLALTADWRMGTLGTEFRMPELEKGIAATLAFTLLNPYGRGFAQEIVIGCKPVPVKTAKQYGLLQQIVTSDKLLSAATIRANVLSNYPKMPFLTTKPVINDSIIQSLDNVLEATKKAHSASFAARSADKHLQTILGNKFTAANPMNLPDKKLWVTGLSHSISPKQYSTLASIPRKTILPHNIDEKVAQLAIRTLKAAIHR